MKIDLPKGGSTLIEDSDRDLVAGKTLYLGTNGYVYYSIWRDGKSTPYTLHSLIVGRAPRGMHIDHVNGVKTDNRRSNLRIVSAQRNQVNRRRVNANNTSGHRGVVYRADLKRPWVAQMMVDRKMLYLGSFHTIQEATQARKDAEREYFGEECPRV